MAVALRSPFGETATRHIAINYKAATATGPGGTGSLIGVRSGVASRSNVHQGCLAACIATGTAVLGTAGSYGGAVLGGTGGTFVLPGAGTVGGGVSGQILGSTGGAILGGTIGGWVASVICPEANDEPEEDSGFNENPSVAESDLGEDEGGTFPIPGTWTGLGNGFDDDPECNRLNEEVNAAKAEVGRLGRCIVGMSDFELSIRRSAWLREAVARAHRDQRCWAGGDEGHQNAQQEAWKHVGNCERLMR